MDNIGASVHLLGDWVGSAEVHWGQRPASPDGSSASQSRDRSGAPRRGRPQRRIPETRTGRSARGPAATAGSSASPGRSMWVGRREGAPPSDRQPQEVGSRVTTFGTTRLLPRRPDKECSSRTVMQP